ncbi:MAG: MotA/TolQ/ExbB proton channel family protein [Treponema sp.]|jgi:biopolymer transport protein ExbB|nr:MotA/TolQ/ExbB proton channel family protein [Treponema sp.]
MDAKFAAAMAFMHSGGPVNWVIVVLYLAALAVFSERLVYFFRTRYSRRRFFDSLRPAEGNRPSKTYLPLRRGGLSGQPERMAAVFLDNLEEEGPLLSERLDREGTVIKAEMEKGQSVLSFITTAAPLLGLLGTITGLMKVFSEIERRGAVADIAFLSGGIREAMITTASGLVTALFASCCGRWFEYRTARRFRDMSLGISLLTDQYRRDLLSLPARSEDRKQARESA